MWPGVPGARKRGERGLVKVFKTLRVVQPSQPSLGPRGFLKELPGRRRRPCRREEARLTHSVAHRDRDPGPLWHLTYTLREQSGVAAREKPHACEQEQKRRT